MTRLTTGLLVAGLQVALVAGVAAKYEKDRATYPRAWARVQPYDPDMPIRGRYVRLQLEVETDSSITYTAPRPGEGSLSFGPPGRAFARNMRFAALRAVDGRVVASAEARTGQPIVPRVTPGSVSWALMEPVAFYIPEHAADPSKRQAGEELWVEVTVPSHGPPRPIRLAVKTHGTLTPLDVR